MKPNLLIGDSGADWQGCWSALFLCPSDDVVARRPSNSRPAARFALLNAAFGEEGYKWERLENYGKNIVSGPFFTQGKMLPL